MLNCWNPWSSVWTPWFSLSDFSLYEDLEEKPMVQGWCTSPQLSNDMRIVPFGWDFMTCNFWTSPELAVEDGGSGHRPFARWIVDRVTASPDLISTLGSYDFFKYHVFLIDSSLPWARACRALDQPRQLMRLDQTPVVFSYFLISVLISFISFIFKNS